MTTVVCQEASCCVFLAFKLLNTCATHVISPKCDIPVHLSIQSARLLAGWLADLLGHLPMGWLISLEPISSFNLFMFIIDSELELV